ncbi:MAG: hypothetical protein ACI9RI_000969, partial [Oceanospirillaceae bacterium]
GSNKNVTLLKTVTLLKNITRWKKVIPRHRKKAFKTNQISNSIGSTKGCSLEQRNEQIVNSDALQAILCGLGVTTGTLTFLLTIKAFLLFRQTAFHFLWAHTYELRKCVDVWLWHFHPHASPKLGW